jgi:hypothetical protein
MTNETGLEYAIDAHWTRQDGTSRPAVAGDGNTDRDDACRIRRDVGRDDDAGIGAPEPDHDHL